jgi:putative oxidoreductase
MRTVRQTLHDLATLAARVGVGGIFFANGWHKLKAGLDATAAQFAELGAPGPDLWAGATMLTELVGGTLLIAGLAVAPFGLLLFAETLAVFVLAAGDQGLPLTGGDVNLIIALGAASVLLAVQGAGRVSVDHVVVIRRREAAASAEFSADTEADHVIAALRDPDKAASASSARPSTSPTAADTAGESTGSTTAGTAEGTRRSATGGAGKGTGTSAPGGPGAATAATSTPPSKAPASEAPAAKGPARGRAQEESPSAAPGPAADKAAEGSSSGRSRTPKARSRATRWESGAPTPAEPTDTLVARGDQAPREDDQG